MSKKKSCGLAQMTLTFTDIWTSDLDDSFTLVDLVDEKKKEKCLRKCLVDVDVLGRVCVLI